MIEEKQQLAATLLAKQIEQEQFQLGLRESNNELQEMSSKRKQLQDSLQQQELLLTSLPSCQEHDSEKEYEYLLEQKQEKQSQLEGLKKELKEVTRKEAKQQSLELSFQ